MKYINFLSYGKDSMAQTIELVKRGYPLDETVYVDIKFAAEQSGEPPKPAAWIPPANDRLRREFGVDVKTITAKPHLRTIFTGKKQREITSAIYTVFLTQSPRGVIRD
jgi:hypothetical protein